MEETTKNRKMRIMDMTEGNPLKLILVFAVPLFIGNIFQQVYSLVDTAVAGYSLGDDAIAAIGATSSLYSLLIDLASGLNSGCAIVVTRLFGAHDEKNLRKAIAGMMELDIIFTVILTALSLIFLNPLLKFLNTPDSIYNESYQYIFVILAGMVTTVAYNCFASILRAFGNSRTSLYFLIISSILNICLDLLFVVVFKMGVMGAALATVIAEGLSGLLSGIYVFKNYKAFLPGKKDFIISKGMLKELLSNGIAMALMYSVVDLGSVIFQRANNNLGETIISAHTSSRRIMGILMQPFVTISTASSTFVGQNWGAKKNSRIKIALKEVMLMEIIWSAICIIIIYSFGGSLVKITTGTADDNVISNAIMSLRYHITLFPVLGCLLTLRTAMQAMELKVAPIISSFLELLLKILSAELLIPHLGYLGTCITEPITWTIMLFFLLVVYFIRRKKLYQSNI